MNKYSWSKKPPQWERVFLHMKKGKTITTYESFVMFGCTSLRDRIRDIEKQGHYVPRKWKQKGKVRYLEYGPL